MTAITEAGLYDMPADIYHSDPVPGGSLSSTGARRILPPGCPALFRYEREHPAAPTSDMILGTAAHTEILGAGPEIVAVEARDWRGKAAQQQRTEAEARGAIALLEDDVARVKAMAAAVRQHDEACKLLNPDHGRPEQAIFWQDEEYGVWRRALIDWLPTVSYGPPTVVDYKTTKSAEKRAIAKAVHNYGYHQQAPWYLDAVASVGYPDDTTFKFIFQEKTPPYLITIGVLDDRAMSIGHARNRRAIEIYRDCAELDIWPGHSTETEVISLPVWAEREEYDA